MQFVIKLLIANMIIVFCSQIGRKYPTLAGLIATMPLTGALVLVWLSLDNPGDYQLMRDYARGALWGIVPSVLFFLSAYACFHRTLALAVVVAISFGFWLLGAFVHQWLLR
jgi:uncharacterized membrane protein (GlpM family)